MKWEKKGPKKRSKLQPRPPRLPLWRERRWCAYCRASPEWKHVQVRTDPPKPNPTSLPALPRLTAALHHWMPSDDAVLRVMGSVFSSRALQQLLQRKRGTLHGWLVHIRNTAQALLFFSIFRCEVKSKTLCKVTYLTQIYFITCPWTLGCVLTHEVKNLRALNEEWQANDIGGSLKCPLCQKINSPNYFWQYCTAVCL